LTAEADILCPRWAKSGFRKRKPVPGRELVPAQSHLAAAVNLPQQVCFLIRQCRLIQDERPAAYLGILAVAAAFQEVLEVDGRVLGPQLILRLAGILQQGGHRQQVEQGPTIVDGAVAVVKAAVIVEEIAEFHALVAFFLPRNLGAGAGPIEVTEEGPGGLAHRPVELRVMGDDERCARDKSLYLGGVNGLPRHVRIGDAGDGRNVRRNRVLRLLQPVEGIQHPVDLPVLAVFEFQHAKLDHLVGAGRQTGGLGIENDACEGIGGGTGGEPLLRHKAARHAIAATRLQGGGNTVEHGIHQAFHSTPTWSEPLEVSRAR
jgi:hypothetical protein